MVEKGLIDKNNENPQIFMDSTVQITNWIIKPVVETFNKQKQFIADASHELKMPLAVIMATIVDIQLAYISQLRLDG